MGQVLALQAALTIVAIFAVLTRCARITISAARAVCAVDASLYSCDVSGAARVFKTLKKITGLHTFKRVE